MEEPPLERFVCASANPGKVAEIASLLAGIVDLIPRPIELADVIEDADSMIGNARLKAAAVGAATGLPAVSDDTGLEVDALGGRPGVLTARYAGADATEQDNRTKMLADLGDLEIPSRRARFRTVAMVVWPDGGELVAEGVCEGHIAVEERGEGGFGYDKLFVPNAADGRTFAEMTDAEKNAVSHRGHAFRNLVEALGRRLNR